MARIFERISEGCDRITVAPAWINSSRVRKPQSTERQFICAFCAVSISTSESPMYTVSVRSMSSCASTSIHRIRCRFLADSGLLSGDSIENTRKILFAQNLNREVTFVGYDSHQASIFFQGSQKVHRFHRKALCDPSSALYSTA